MKIKVTIGKKQNITIESKDLIGSSIENIVEEKIGKSNFVIEDVLFSGDKCKVVVGDGVSEIVDIDDNELIDKSIKQVVKNKFKLKTTKGLNISIIKAGK